MRSERESAVNASKPRFRAGGGLRKRHEQLRRSHCSLGFVAGELSGGFMLGEILDELGYKSGKGRPRSAQTAQWSPLDQSEGEEEQE